MSSRRTARVAQAIRETVSTAILFELRDPRIKNVTVLGAEVTADLSRAKVFVSVMGDPKTQARTMHGLTAARGFLQAKVANRLQTKTTPVLQFVLDPSVKRSIEASRLLRGVLPEGEESAEPGSNAPESADAETADTETTVAEEIGIESGMSAGQIDDEDDFDDEDADDDDLDDDDYDDDDFDEEGLDEDDIQAEADAPDSESPDVSPRPARAGSLIGGRPGNDLPSEPDSPRGSGP